MRKSRGKYDAQAVADIPLRRKAAQLTSKIAIYDDKGDRRPFVEGLPINDLIALIADELDRAAAASDLVLEAAGTVDLVTATGTLVELPHSPVADPFVVIESAHVVLTRAPTSLPGVNEYRRNDYKLHLNTARAGATLKIAYAYKTLPTNPGFEDVTAVGTAITLTEVPIFPPLLVYGRGHLVLTEVSGTPGPNHFSRSGRVLTLHASRAGITVKAIYAFAEPTELKQESLDPGGYPTFDATLAETPLAVDRVMAIWGPSNLPLRYVAGAPGANDFTVSGTSLTSGREMTEGGQLHVLYPHA